MTAELWDLTDRSGAPSGRTHRRGDEIPSGSFHVVASVCAVRADGRILVTRRAAGKTFALSLEIPAGSALAGESSDEAAARELAEETGIDVPRDELQLVGRFVEESALFDLYAASAGDDPAVVPDPDEVAGFRWITLDELDELVAGGEMADPWVPRLESFRPRLDERVRLLAERVGA
ncbi:NUDIX domain-containing protein [Microbacterium karelineae]|uniref:NUDIX domain-containing protein n=1 Tax=Microbacterium karelineae TaxID=2654283 RepID=UPI0018D47409|nr:NUDIX domain-containing protein [Microbacterium karelineae]